MSFSVGALLFIAIVIIHNIVSLIIVFRMRRKERKLRLEAPRYIIGDQRVGLGFVKDFNITGT